MPDHTFALSKSAAVELLTLSTTRGLLTKPVHLRKVSQFMREHLAPLDLFGLADTDPRGWQVQYPQEKRITLASGDSVPLGIGATSPPLYASDLIGQTVEIGGQE